MFRLVKNLLGFVRFLVSKPVVITLLLVWQVWLLLGVLRNLGSNSTYLYIVFVLLSYVVTLRLLNSTVNPAFKLALIIPIMIFPVFGGPFYVVFGSNRVGSRELRIFGKARNAVLPWLKQDEEILASLDEQDRYLGGQARYISVHSSFPLHQETSSTYLPSGDAFFYEMIAAVKAAKHSVFLEFFIIRPGKLWTEILEALEQKVAEGVDVRLIYDDMGCIFQLPQDYYRTLRAKGIRCMVFNPYRPTLSMTFNHRDHRKIAIVDGYIGFTGGINIDDQYADSYAGRPEGTWCDSGVKLQGAAVWNLTMMFLEAWSSTYEGEDDFALMRPECFQPEPFPSEGYIQPFGDTPFDDELVSETAYMNVMNQAVDYLLITTPYLVTSNEMMTALCSAAKRGVEVSILTPNTVENWLIHSATEASFQQLIEAGCKIYRYTPGFIHGKNLLCDGRVGIVGSVNLDFRSLYLSFECAVWMTGCQALQEMEKDLRARFAVSTQVTLQECLSQPLLKRLAQSFMRILAPLI